VPLGDSNTSVCLAEHSCDLQANGTRLGDVVPVARYPGFPTLEKSHTGTVVPFMIVLQCVHPYS